MAKIAKRRGRYVIDFYDNTGTRRWKTMKVGCTKKEAKDKLREVENQLERGVYLPDRKVPSFEKVAEDWLGTKKISVRGSTLAMYKGHIKNHFESVKALKINRISVGMVEKFISDNRAAGMNITTLRKLIVTFNQVMSYAVRHRYIDYNPVRDAERPRRNGADEDKPVVVLTPKQIGAFLKAVKGQQHNVMIKLAILSGARQGELLGLKWSDIDFKANQIQIDRTYNNGAWYRPKSKASKRRIDIGPSMMRALKKWKLQCPPTELNLVFPSENGEPLNHSVLLRKHFWPALKASKLPDIRFHDLRHTYASLLIDQGENIKYIQSQLGHSSPTVTLNIYAHLLKPENHESAKKLENTVFEVHGSKMVAEANEEGGKEAVST